GGFFYVVALTLVIKHPLILITMNIEPFSSSQIETFDMTAQCQAEFRVKVITNFPNNLKFSKKSFNMH
ncbi:hypothetical protein, partial [uncultured Duncaniella sp.]|uniref:hypothetical protein n=1 Tax=uncultured Duncaniella sp. TaxID=2768039 RepID=UPI0026F39AEA